MVEHNQVERTLRRLNIILRTMREVDQIILEESDRHQLIVRVCRRLVRTRGYFNAWIALLDGSERFTTFAEAGVGTEFSLLTEQLKSGRPTSCVENALAHSNAMVIDDPAVHCTDCPLAKKYIGRGGIAAQLKYGKKLYGILCASVPHSLTTEAQERALFEDIAKDIAFALYKIDLEMDREQAEEALKESESRYRLLFDYANDGMLVHDLEGNIFMANNAMSQLTGYTIDELLKINTSSFLLAEDFENTLAEITRQLKEITQTQTKRHELQIVTKDGKRRTIDVVYSALPTIVGHPVIQTIVRDITEQKRAQDDLHAYARRAILAQEEERKRVARELHDDTAQALVSLGMDINSLARSKDGISVKTSKRMEELRDRANDILRGVRSISQALRPAMLEELGLLAALQVLIDELVSQRSVSARFEVRGTQRRLPMEKELILFRIAQEALSNVWKHAKATECIVSVEFSSKNTTLRISDNGQGFESTAITEDLAYPSRLGLTGMRERAQLINGNLTIQSRPGEGTTVVLEVAE